MLLISSLFITVYALIISYIRCTIVRGGMMRNERPTRYTLDIRVFSVN